MSEQKLNAGPEVEEVKRLQEKVLGFEQLLQAFQKSQLEQTQALAAFVSHIGGDKKINTSAANIDANISTNVKANTSTATGLNKDTDSPTSTMSNTKIGPNTEAIVGRKSSASSQYLQVQRKALKSAQQPQNSQTLARGKTVSKAAPYLGNVSSTLQTFDQDISIWAELSGIDEDALKSNMKMLEERFINTPIPDPKAASDELRQAGFNFSWIPKEGYEEEEKPDDLRLPEFLSLVGGDHQPVGVHLRDFTDRSCEKVLYYEATDFEGLWQALARPRKLGMKIKNTRIRHGWDKISAYEAINEDGENNLTYGREIVVRQLTPNVAIALLISCAYSGLRLEYVEPLDSLLTAMTIALSPEPHSLQDFVGYMNHDTFSFNAVFFELFDEESPNQRKATVFAPKSYGGKKFGSIWEGVFAPKNVNRHSKPKNIRQTTLSLVFDSMATETGTNWTVTSIGEYSDDKAFEKPRNVKDVEKYTAPEEVFLDKLARVIDWAVDDGMWKVLDQLERELGDRADALFFTEENEKLLFDDHQFSRTKRYHWALQWLKKMSDSINEFVTAIEEFEKISLPNLRRNAQAHRIRSRVRMAKAELSSEKVFERKVERAKKLRAKIEAKYSEIKDFRDALVSASGVLESRAAVSQAESMHTLTVLMIIFLPLTVVIALYSMPFMPETYQTLSAFGVTMGLVIMTTLILGLNLGSIILIFANKSQRFGTYLQSSMLVVGDSWEEKGKLLQATDEAENLVRRGKRVPAELWYTWYCMVWILFLLPATELYKIGGLRCLMNTGYVKMTASSQSNPPNHSEPLWAIAMIPLRIALLPVHFLAIIADYFLTLIFSKTLLGWDCSSKGFIPIPAKPMNPRQGTIKGDIDLDENIRPPWKQRLWDPIAILKEIPTRGIGKYRQPENQMQNKSTPVDYSGNGEYAHSSMDLLLKDIVKHEKDIGLRASVFSGSGSVFGGIKRSGPVEIVFSSGDVSDNMSIRSGLISPALSGLISPALSERQAQSTSDPEQGSYTLPPVSPESATSPTLPMMSALTSNNSWELPHLGNFGRTISRNRGQEVDPERGERQTFIIPE